MQNVYLASAGNHKMQTINLFSALVVLRILSARASNAHARYLASHSIVAFRFNLQLYLYLFFEMNESLHFYLSLYLSHFAYRMQSANLVSTRNAVTYTPDATRQPGFG